MIEPLENRYALSGLAGAAFSTIDGNSFALPGVLISVVGKDTQNNVIASASIRTAADGTYRFAGLPAGNYSLTQSQPTGLANGNSVVGSLGGTAGNDVISNIVLGEGADGTGYHFREQGTAVVSINLFLASTPPTAQLLAKVASSTGSTAPAVAIASVTDPINSLNAGSLTASGIGKPGAAVSVVVASGSSTSAARTATVAPDGAWSVSGLDATQLANGAVTYRATITDSSGQTATSTLPATKFTTAPVAVDDTYALAIGASLTTTAANGVLANDSGGATHAVLISGPAHGPMTLNPDGTFTYAQTTYGFDQFVYEVTNASGETDQATVTIRVPNLPPLPAGAVLTPTASGLQFYDFEVGTGASPSATDTVTVDYVGYLPNGNIFDSDNNHTFALSGLIEGFSEGVQGMKVGGMRRLIIPPDLGYGPGGNPGAGIGGTDTIVFDVTLDAIV